MPSKYGCQSCTLEFEVGWSIYPGFANGYAAMTLLVCGACGHQHAVEIALRSRGTELIQHFEAHLVEVPDASRPRVLAYLRDHATLEENAAQEALNHLPYQLGSDLSENQGLALLEEYSERGALVELTVVSESPNPQYGPLQRDRFLIRTAAPGTEEKQAWSELSVLGLYSDDGGAFEVALQACGGCQQVGELRFNWPADRPCPACGSRLEERGRRVA